MAHRLVFLLSLSTLFWACSQEQPSYAEARIALDYNDPTVRLIYALQDKRLSDSLITYFEHPEAMYRYQAVMAMASVRDSAAVPALGRCLADEVPAVRIAAAFALGQTAHPSAGPLLVDAFDQSDSTGTNARFNATVLEAVGKCADSSYLAPLSSISTYLNSDTLLLTGQAWGIYRYALRGISSQAGTDLMASYVLDLEKPQPVRYIAANYLARARGIQLDSFANELAERFQRERQMPVALPLALALGKTQADTARVALTRQLVVTQDNKLKINIIRALGSFEYAKVKEAVLPALQHKDQQVALAAAQFFQEHGNSEDGKMYADLAPTLPNWPLRAAMYGAAMRNLSYVYTGTKSRISSELWAQYDSLDNDYERAAIARALGEFGWNYQLIKEKVMSAEQPLLRSTAVEILGSILRSPDFYRLFQGASGRVRREIAAHLQEAVENGDVGMAAAAAQIIGDTTLDLKGLYEDAAFLEQASRRLSLPRDIEAYNELARAYTYVADSTLFAPKVPDYNHPVDWQLFGSLGEQPTVRIRSSKGDIELVLFAQDAPGTVVNFIQLAKSGFFDGKAVHRVVPNFVIQSGCPRGDGYGSLDYSIRSEFWPSYYDAEGYVGMASAGPDTEATQWFITHSPTPHLDGRYTLFGKVSKGQEVVDALSIGDRIEGVELL